VRGDKSSGRLFAELKTVLRAELEVGELVICQVGRDGGFLWGLNARGIAFGPWYLEYIDMKIPRSRLEPPRWQRLMTILTMTKVYRPF